ASDTMAITVTDDWYSSGSSAVAGLVDVAPVSPGERVSIYDRTHAAAHLGSTAGHYTLSTPEGSSAQVETGTTRASFTPDVPGVYRLEFRYGAAADTLTIETGLDYSFHAPAAYRTSMSSAADVFIIADIDKDGLPELVTRAD